MKPTPADDMVDRVKSALKNNGGGKEALAALRSPESISQPAHTSASAIVRTTPSNPGARQCLLLDVSGSMSEECEPGRSKWQALRALLPQFALAQMFAFSDDVRPCGPASLPPPSSGTNMAGAFIYLKSHRIGHAVLITDGLPNDEEAALREARGLRLDIFYVGPAPRPAFLDRLAAATGGSAQTASLKTSSQPQLAKAVRAMLALPAAGGTQQK
jgi:hypothetical protein